MDDIFVDSWINWYRWYGLNQTNMCSTISNMTYNVASHNMGSPNILPGGWAGDCRILELLLSSAATGLNWSLSELGIRIQTQHYTNSTKHKNENTTKCKNTPTGASTNPKNFDLNKNLNMNLIWIETWNWNFKLETETWNLKL